MKLFASKRGQILNYVVVILFLFLFGFVSIFSLTLFQAFLIEFEASGHYSQSAQVVGNGMLKALNTLDVLMVLILAMLIIGIGITSFRLQTAPAFFVVSIIGASFLGFVGYMFSFMFQELVGQSVFAASLVAFPLTLVICTNLHWVALIVFIVGSVTLYAKREKGLGAIQ